MLVPREGKQIFHQESKFFVAQSSPFYPSPPRHVLTSGPGRASHSIAGTSTLSLLVELLLPRSRETVVVFYVISQVNG